MAGTTKLLPFKEVVDTIEECEPVFITLIANAKNIGMPANVRLALKNAQRSYGVITKWLGQKATQSNYAAFQADGTVAKMPSARSGTKRSKAAA